MACKAGTFVSYAALFLLLCIFSYCVSEASATDTLNPGDRLNSSDRLVSPNELFELRFHGNLLGIWFSGRYSSSHPVWLANRNPTFANDTGVLTLDASGNLRILHTNGDLIQTIYSGNESVTNATAALRDSGNLVLKEANSKQVLWQSFDHPTDTLLPGMKLGINKKTREILSLTSWLGEDNPSPGAFTMEWEPNEEQLIIKRRGRRFWSSGKRCENMFLDKYNNNYNFTNQSNTDESFVSYSLRGDFTRPDRGTVSRRLLNYNGDICEVELSGSMICNAYSEGCDGSTSTEHGCAKWEGPKCRRDGAKFKNRVANIWPASISPFDDTLKNLTLADCKELCWQDCKCSGVDERSGLGNGCRFYYGRFNYDDLTGNEYKFYVIIPGPRTNKGVWIAIAVSTTVIVALMGIFLYLRWRRLRLEEKFLKELMTLDRPSDANELENGGNRNNLQVYSATEIKTATNGFSLANKLGEGGFGPVYKGKFAQGQEIAVKRLSRKSGQGQGLVEFKNELILIAKLQHSNLVRLLGFCVQGEEKMLVYEYLPNKSLDFFIFGDQSKRKLLDWNKRFSIIEGIAQGLLYLHKYSRPRIIHRDLKASNILLENDMNPKISDFGMARIFRPDEPKANTIRVVGTRGYIPPEAMEGKFSVESDVYSFGVLVLEVVSGKKNHSIYDFDRMLNFVGYAWELWKVDPLKLVELAIMESAVKDQVLKCINVSLLCVQHNPCDRPTMSDVLSMLASDVNQLRSPKQPAFYNVERNSVIENSAKEQTQVNCSANQMTLTEMVGR